MLTSVTSQRRSVLLAILVFISAAIGFLICESAYRIKRFALSEQQAYRLNNIVYGQFDKDFGERFLPNSRLVSTVVQNGKVVGCFGEVASANEDGLGGKDTLATYDRAAIKLITTGDSFTHWKRSGVTIPDIVAARLRTQAGTSVANLDFGRGAYGMLHMLKIGSSMAEAHKPDLLIVQFITDDLTRGWWWSTEQDVAGRKRALLSKSLVGLTDGTANDEYIVDARATESWCEERLKRQDEDVVLTDANSFYSSYRREKGLDFNPWSLTKSYVLLRILYGPTMTKKGSAATGALPRIGYDEFANDPIVSEAAARLRQSHTRVVFVHLPRGGELAGNLVLTNEEKRIWQHIEKEFETRILTAAQVPIPSIPEKIDLQPLDGHPNDAGIDFYGQYVARAVISRGLLQPAGGL